VAPGRVRSSDGRMIDDDDDDDDDDKGLTLN